MAFVNPARLSVQAINAFTQLYPLAPSTPPAIILQRSQTHQSIRNAYTLAFSKSLFTYCQSKRNVVSNIAGYWEYYNVSDGQVIANNAVSENNQTMLTTISFQKTATPDEINKFIDDLIKFTDTGSPNQDLNIFDYILLNVRHPGWASNQEFATNLVNQLNKKPRFKLTYQQDDIYLFTKN